MRARVWVGGSMSTLRDAGRLALLCGVTAGCIDDSAQTALSDGGLAPSIDDISGNDAFDAAGGDGSAAPIWVAPISEGGPPAQTSGAETDSARMDRDVQRMGEAQEHAPGGTLDAGTGTSLHPADSGVAQYKTRADAEAGATPSGPSAFAGDSGADTTAVGQPTPFEPTPVEPLPSPTDPAPSVPLPAPPSADAALATPPSALAPDPVTQAPSAPSSPSPPALPQTPGAISDAPPSQPADSSTSDLTPDAATSGDDAGSFADAGAAPPDGLPSLDAGANDIVSDAGAGGDDQDAGVQLVPLLDAGSAAIEAPDADVGLAACQACVANSCTYAEYGDLVDDCQTLTDFALDGTRAGEARSQLCMDLLSCARRTRCAAEDVVNCLCGTMNQDACLEAPQLATGPCAAEAVAGTETTDDYDIVDRLLDNVYPSGAALNLADCESRTCAAVCP